MSENWIGRISFITLGALLLPLLALALAPQIHAQSRDDVCQGVGAVTGSADPDTDEATCDLPEGSTSFEAIVRVAINILSGLVGIASVVMVIFGGYKYTTSDGDAGKIAGARQTIIYALVGALFVAVSQVIVLFVLSRAGPPPAEPDASLRVALIQPKWLWYK